jgi:poly(3-hydroxyalkanoate) depolymerase
MTVSANRHPPRSGGDDEMMRSIVIHGRRLRLAVRPGDGRRPPLVLANGIGANLELLQPFVDALDPAIGVIRFDVPGVGGSPLPARPYRLPGLARLLGRMLHQLGYPRVDMLGISWGGGLAQQFAFQNPRRCRKLVLVSTATGALMVPADPRILGKMMTPRRHRDLGYATSIADRLYGGSIRDDAGQVHELLHAHARAGSQRGYYYQLAAAAGWTSLPFLPLLRQPTLILAGDDDPIIPLVNARMMKHLIPGARLHVYHDGHLGLITRAAELGPLVSEFLHPGFTR